MNSTFVRLREEYSRAFDAAVVRLEAEAGITDDTDYGDWNLWWLENAPKAEARGYEAVRDIATPEEWSEFRAGMTLGRSIRTTQRANGRDPSSRRGVERVLTKKRAQTGDGPVVIVAGLKGVWMKRELSTLIRWEHPDFDAELEKLVSFDRWEVKPELHGRTVEFRPSFTGVSEGLRDLLRGRVDHLNSLGLVATNVPTDGTVHGAGSLSA